jgi:hypothetical protein
MNIFVQEIHQNGREFFSWKQISMNMAKIIYGIYVGS